MLPQRYLFFSIVVTLNQKKYRFYFTSHDNLTPITKKSEAQCESLRFFLLWSWGESNPRPNSLPESFLHAYPLLNPPAAMRWVATKSQPQFRFGFALWSEHPSGYLLIDDTPCATPTRSGRVWRSTRFRTSLGRRN